MSLRQFNSEWYTVIAGWDQLAQRYYLDIYERYQEDDWDPIFSSTRLLSSPMTLEQIGHALDDFEITAPPAFLTDLREDAALARGDADVVYDPETGTSSIQAEYGDRTDLGDADAALPTERNRVQELADRIRAWFHRDQQQDQGMGF
jgi:hypothetical protein